MQKASVAIKEVGYLGFVLAQEGIKPQPKEVVVSCFGGGVEGGENVVQKLWAQSLLGSLIQKLLKG